MTTEELLEFVRVYAQERYPRTPAVRVSIELADGDKVKLRVPDHAGRRETTIETGADAQRAVTRTERRILKAVEGMNGESPTGEEIAQAAKLPYESHLRKTLLAMRLKGLLGGAKGESGYPITTLGLEAIEPEVA